MRAVRDIVRPRLHAYVLAADPAWAEHSLLSYYDLVDTIVLSFDVSGRGWTGHAIAAEESLRRMKSVDRDGKLTLCGGEYARRGQTPLDSETYQRQTALREAEKGADWVLQIDTDEILPDPNALLDALMLAERYGAVGVEWPMRVIFGQLRDGRFLEVCEEDGGEHFEYPGAIAVRPGAELVDARRASGSFLRLLVEGHERSLQLRQPPAPGEIRITSLRPEQAICHLSWVGGPGRIRRKVMSWGHSRGWRSWAFYYLRWKPVRYRWRHTRDFHPFAEGLWPALRPSSNLPPSPRLPRT
jgi:hypothetical protein